MNWRKWGLILGIAAVFILLNVSLTLWKEGKLAVRSAAGEELFPPHQEHTGNEPAYDLWGRSFTSKEAEQLMKTEEGRALLSPQNGAVKIDDALLQLGKKAFYNETFGNEVFITDIMGAFDGPITLANVKKAVEELMGQGTDNLQVELAKTVTIGGKTLRSDRQFAGIEGQRAK